MPRLTYENKATQYEDYKDCRIKDFFRLEKSSFINN